MLTLSLISDSRAEGPLVLDLTQPEKLADLKKNPVVIKVRSFDLDFLRGSVGEWEKLTLGGICR